MGEAPPGNAAPKNPFVCPLPVPVAPTAPGLTPVLSLMLEQSSVMSAPLSSVISVMPLKLLESSMAQSLERLSCWYWRAGSWMAWISMLESTSFPTLRQEGKRVMKRGPRQDQAGLSWGSQTQETKPNMCPRKLCRTLSPTHTRGLVITR